MRTTHYRASIDVRKALAETSEETRKDAEAASAILRTDTFPAEAWIDDAGLPRRIVMSFEGEDEGAAFKVEVSMEYFDYGTPVEIKIPSPDQTLELPDQATLERLCMGAMRGSAGGTSSGSSSGSGRSSGRGR